MEKLVDAITEHQNDWIAISTELNKPAEQCVIKFLEMPITENIMTKLQSYNSSAEKDENQQLVKQSYPSVLMDTSNPLMSQVAIFARCLEERESIVEEKLQQASLE